MNKAHHIVYVVSGIEKSMAFEWVASRLNDSYRLTFVLLHHAPTAMEEFLSQNNIDFFRVNFRGKRDYIGTFFKLYQYFRKTRPDVVHAHLLNAQLLALTASLCAGIKKRIYTRHTSDFHHVYYRKGVLYDRISNRLATHIVSISQATDKTLTMLEDVGENKIRRIPHGFDLSFFDYRNDENSRLIRKKWNIPDTFPCIGVIARQIEWKGIQYIIPAFQKLLKDYPDALLILANATGPFHPTIANMLAPIPQNNYVLIPFEADIVSLYHLFTLYVHVPVNERCEAFGQTYVEALAAGIPSIFTKSGIASEFVEHKKNAWVVNYRSSDEIYRAIKSVLLDENLRRHLADEGRRSVKQFEIDGMIGKLQLLYDE